MRTSYQRLVANIEWRRLKLFADAAVNLLPSLLPETLRSKQVTSHQKLDIVIAGIDFRNVVAIAFQRRNLLL